MTCVPLIPRDHSICCLCNPDADIFALGGFFSHLRTLSQFPSDIWLDAEGKILYSLVSSTLASKTVAITVDM